MKALVTGATGFVGAAVARALVRTGAEVRVLARPDSGLRNLDGLPVERVAGDLRDPRIAPQGSQRLPPPLPCGGALHPMGQRSLDLL